MSSEAAAAAATEATTSAVATEVCAVVVLAGCFHTRARCFALIELLLWRTLRICAKGRAIQTAALLADNCSPQPALLGCTAHPSLSLF